MQKDNPEATKKIESLPPDMRKFFKALSSETRRIIVSDEYLLSADMERLRENFNRLMGAARSAGLMRSLETLITHNKKI